MPQSDVSFIDLNFLLAAARRQLKVVLACALGALLLGIVYVLMATPIYTATATVLIDKNQSKVVNDIVQEQPMSGTLIDAQMSSQVELLTSDSIGLKVIDKLNLVDNEDFLPKTMSLKSSVISAVRMLLSPASWFGSPVADVSQADGMRYVALRLLQQNLSVSRVGMTYVLNVSYASPNRTLAAQIANAIVDAYTVDALDAKYDSTKRAGAWLEGRIDELRQQFLQADTAVQDYKSQKGLQSTNGQLVSEAQLGEISTQLTTARADTASALALSNTLKGILASGRTDAVVNDALTSPTITALRDKYLYASRREAEVTKQFGAEHPQAVNSRREMQQYSDQIHQELLRIGQSYQNNYEVALSRQKSLEASLDDALNRSAGNDETQVQLRELQRRADAYKTLYENFMQRYQEAMQEQSFPVTDARTISAASPPQRPSAPRKSLALALALVLGGMVGVGVGAVREYRERFFRTGEQIRQELGLPYLGALPMLPQRSVVLPASAREEAIQNGQLLYQNPMLEWVRTNSNSMFAETLRGIKVNADLFLQDKRASIIGVVSCLPGEGKSTTTANLAALLTMQGASVLLIDGDLRNPGLSRGLAEHAGKGVADVLAGEARLEEATLRDASGRLTVLPIGHARRAPDGRDFLGLGNMARLLAEAGPKFDYVLVDLPPISPVVDIKIFTGCIDAFVMVVEWGGTARTMVSTSFNNNPVLYEKCIGVVMNKVDVKKLKFYQNFGSHEYYQDRFTDYYTGPA